MRKWLVLAGVLSVLACESAEEKCANARSAALTEWDGYVRALEQARGEAAKAQREASVKLKSDVEKRLMPEARKLADRRYPPGSEAWLRASTTAYNDLCATDKECRTLKRHALENGALVDDLDERLVLARAARDAARGDVDGASKAASAAILHPEYPQLKQAQARVAELHDVCAGLPVPSDETASAARP